MVGNPEPFSPRPVIVFTLFDTLVRVSNNHLFDHYLGEQLLSQYGNGSKFMARWRSLQLAMIRRLNNLGQYTEFDRVIMETLLLTARVQLLPDHMSNLIKLWGELDTHPDVDDAMRLIAAEGITTVLFTNATRDQLNYHFGKSPRLEALGHMFQDAITVDEAYVKAFMPSKHAFRHLLMIIDKVDRPQDVYFISAQMEDVLGAAAAGMRANLILRSPISGGELPTEHHWAYSITALFGLPNAPPTESNLLELTNHIVKDIKSRFSIPDTVALQSRLYDREVQRHGTSDGRETSR